MCAKNKSSNNLMNNNLDLITFKKRMSSIVFGQNKLSDYARIQEADLGNV